MGQRRRRFLAFAASAVAAPAVLRPSRASAAEQMLRLHHFLPPVSNAHANVLTPWAKKIETESQGAIRIRIYPSMQLGGAPPQLFDQACDGVADIVWTLPGYTAGRFPKLETFELPFVATRSGVINSKAVQDFAVQHAQDELREVHLLFAWANDHGVIHATKPIHKQEDLQGRKIRFPTRLVGEALKALGAGAVGMPVPQIPESLAQRVIDGAVVPWEVMPALKLHELVGHHTEFPHAPTFYTSIHVLVMNKARYDGMPAELRQVLDANSGLEPSALAGAAWDKAGAAARQKAQDRGNEVFTLPDDEVARWRQATQPVTDAWVAARPDGAQLLDAARALIARHAQA
jgi:TRAP-type C4-dicarboxylate transport system substrate-binding protein